MSKNAANGGGWQITRLSHVGVRDSSSGVETTVVATPRPGGPSYLGSFKSRKELLRERQAGEGKGNKKKLDQKKKPIMTEPRKILVEIANEYRAERNIEYHNYIFEALHSPQRDWIIDLISRAVRKRP